MEVAILQPYDCLKPHPHQPRRYRYSSSVNSNTNKSNRRRRNSNSPPPQQQQQQKRQLSSNGLIKAQQVRPKSPPVMGQVRILKRGEQLIPPSIPSTEPGLIRSEPGPVQGGLPFYAGSAFITSPSPSEVPLPGFFGRKTGCEAHNQVIACELKRVLKLV